MKFILLSVSVLLTFFTSSCHNKKSFTIASGDGKSKVSVDVNGLSSPGSDMQKTINELKTLTPLTTDRLKDLLPSSVNGIPRSSFELGNTMGFATAEASYIDSANDKNIHLSIFDCAGEAGAGVYSLSFWTKMNMQSETDNGYSKTIDYNGDKAVESYDKGSDVYELTYIASKRLLVTIKGEKTGLDAVKAAGKEMHLQL